MSWPWPLPPAEFAARRTRVAAALGDGVLVAAAGAPAAYSRDITHRFRPDADFLYLTGFPEPHAVAVLRGGSTPRFELFVEPRDPTTELWSGRRAGIEGALAEYGADAAHPLAQLGERLPELLDGAERIVHTPWAHPTLDSALRRALGQLARKESAGRRAPGALTFLGAFLHPLRLVKTAAEQDALRRAAALTAAGVRAGIGAVGPERFEYEVQAAIEGRFRAGGAAGPGFETIVAGGARGCTLHYVENRARLAAGELVVIDAGAELGGYNGDLTRTVPVSGSFTAPQRALYDVVLAALAAATAAVVPGATLASVHAAACAVLVDGMLAHGLLRGDRAELLAAEGWKRCYPHRTSHWLGLDVHDVGASAAPLAPGMALTVEPGLYIQPDDAESPAEFRGIGIRIEDDVLVTPDGGAVLSTALPTAADEVAALVGTGPGVG